MGQYIYSVSALSDLIDGKATVFAMVKLDVQQEPRLGPRSRDLRSSRLYRRNVKGSGLTTSHVYKIQHGSHLVD